jgi:nucleoside-diphosphate-sugar epimerase
MSKLLIVGCGDLGAAVAVQLAELGFETIGLKRTLADIPGVSIILADVTQPETLHSLRETQPDIIVYCVAANGQTDEQYKAQYVDGLRNVLNTQQENSKLKHVFFVSSTRVYGQVTEELLSEETTALPADFGGLRLLEAENLLNNISCGSTVLRLSGIYGPGRLRMIKLAQSQNWPADNSWTNRIHRDDAASFIVFLLQKAMASDPIEPCYIVTDSKPASQYEVLSWIANRLNLSPPPITPNISSGKRLSNRLLLVSGFQLRYPDFKAGYQTLLESIDAVT